MSPPPGPGADPWRSPRRWYASIDVAPHVDNTTNGPMTRSRVKALHEKVTSLLSMYDFDIPLNGLLLHAGTLCILRIHLDDDLQ